jgi:DNA-binding MarR family transcriptional regulator
VRPPRPPQGGPHGLSDLAAALGVPESKLMAALDKLHRRHEAAFAKELAGALGIPEARVTAALGKLRSQENAEHGAMRHSLAAALARRLGIPLSRVEGALKSLPRPPGPPGHHGPW